MKNKDNYTEINSKLIASPIEEHRVLAAKAVRLTREQQFTLARDISETVKMTLAGNQDIFSETADILAADGSYFVRDIVRENKNISPLTKQALTQEYYEHLANLFVQIYDDRFIPNASDLVEDMQEPEQDRGDITSLNAGVRYNGYKYLLENASSEKVRQDTLQLVKKDSSKEIRNLYQEYVSKESELEKPQAPEKEQKQDKEQEPEKKHSVREALGI